MPHPLIETMLQIRQLVDQTHLNLAKKLPHPQSTLSCPYDGAGRKYGIEDTKGNSIIFQLSEVPPPPSIAVMVDGQKVATFILGRGGSIVLESQPDDDTFQVEGYLKRQLFLFGRKATTVKRGYILGHGALATDDGHGKAIVQLRDHISEVEIDYQGVAWLAGSLSKIDLDSNKKPMYSTMDEAAEALEKLRNNTAQPAD